jgi:hypothetical protein
MGRRLIFKGSKKADTKQKIKPAAR